jgi:hypothetical protein
MRLGMGLVKRRLRSPAWSGSPGRSLSAQDHPEELGRPTKRWRVDAYPLDLRLIRIEGNGLPQRPALPPGREPALIAEACSPQVAILAGGVGADQTPESAREATAFVCQRAAVKDLQAERD